VADDGSIVAGTNIGLMLQKVRAPQIPAAGRFAQPGTAQSTRFEAKLPICIHFYNCNISAPGFCPHGLADSFISHQKQILTRGNI
jgi:hypothetical protein